MIVLDDASPTPPYEQIRLQLRGQILERELLAGMRLPTVRRLAADLGVATNTVGRAYKELEAAGLVITRRRAGTVVAADGDNVRERAHRAAITFVQSMSGLGIGSAEAVRLVKAAYQDQ